MLCALLCAASFAAIGGTSGAASSSTVISATVPSASSLDMSACNTGPAYSASVLADAPAGYWRLDESSGTTAADASGNAVTGTYTGTPQLQRPGALLADGNKATRFDGVDDYIALGSPASLKPNTFSVEAWFRTSRGGDIYRYRSHGILLWVSASGVSGGFYNSVGTRQVATAPGTFTDDAWHHTIVTFDGAQVRVFVDGKLLGMQASTEIPYYHPSGLAAIGRAGDLSQEYFDGHLDEVAFYPGALPANRIAAHVHAAQTGSSALGAVLPSSGAVSGSDCSITFGSSNDTSMMRAYQADGGGRAMYGPAITTDAVGYWPMEGTRDNAAGASAGLSPFAGPQDPSFTPGFEGRGQGLDFDGDDVAEIPHHASQSTDTFTVDAWFRTSSLAAQPYEILVVKQSQDASIHRNFILYFARDSNRLAGSVSTNAAAGWAYAATDATPLVDNRWHHVALVSDGAGTLSLYVDGLPRDSSAIVGNIDNPAAPVTIGAESQGAGMLDFFTGQMDEVRIANVARSAAELRDYYRATVPDYGSGSDWATAGASLFGACLRSVSGAGAAAVWSVNASCPATDGAHWKAIPQNTASTGAKVASSSTAGSEITASLRFGVRAKADQAPGDYRAPVAFEVVAPNS